MRKLFILFAAVMMAAGTMAQDYNPIYPQECSQDEVIGTDQDGIVIFKVVDQMPEFPGGVNAFVLYLQKNLRYPMKARKNGIEGRVLVQFVVEKDGRISDIDVIRSSGNEMLDKEAVRVIHSMPRWKPGSNKGKPVRVSYTAPINFRLR